MPYPYVDLMELARHLSGCLKELYVSEPYILDALPHGSPPGRGVSNVTTL